MNKILLTTIVALLFVCATTQAQVKDKYQDKSNEMTTIVVKEDAANDMDILNDQFDLDDVGMHQVIRITTREEMPPELAVQIPSNNNIDLEPVAVVTAPEEDQILTASVERPSNDVAATPMISTVKTVAEGTVAIEQEEEPVAAPIAVTAAEPVAKPARQRSARASSSSSAKRKSNRHQFKAFNKKFKKQKRKRVPRKRKRNKRCYRF